jgi:hypothetical protein
MLNWNFVEKKILTPLDNSYDELCARQRGHDQATP